MDSQNPSTSGVNLAQEDDRSSNHGDFGPASPPGTLRDEDSSDSEGSCETSRHSVPGKQTNNITVKNPTGPTTLVINSFPSISSTSRVQLACPKVPDDIASMPAFPPVQPVNIKYPATLISGKARSFNPALYKVYPWLEYSIQRDVTAVVCLALDLVPNVKNPSH